MKSSAPTSSVSVELRVLSFCFVEITIGNPRPKYNPPPECPRMLGWTANDASTHHFKMPLPLALRISSSVLVLLMYLIIFFVPFYYNRLGWVLKLSSLETLHLCNCPAWLVWWNIKSLPRGCETAQSYHVVASCNLRPP